MNKDYGTHILQKWEQSGFLVEVEEKDKTELSILYEKVYMIIKNGEYETIDTIVFPCIRRTFIKAKIRDIEVSHYVETLHHLLYNNEEQIYRSISEKYSGRVDGEAELCLFFSEIFYPLYANRRNKRTVLIEKNNYLFRLFCLLMNK